MCFSSEENSHVKSSGQLRPGDSPGATKWCLLAGTLGRLLLSLSCCGGITPSGFALDRWDPRARTSHVLSPRDLASCQSKGAKVVLSNNYFGSKWFYDIPTLSNNHFGSKWLYQITTLSNNHFGSKWFYDITTQVRFVFKQSVYRFWLFVISLGNMRFSLIKILKPWQICCFLGVNNFFTNGAP